MTSITLSLPCPMLKAIFTKGICQRLLEALRSKSPTTASDLLSLKLNWLDMVEGTCLPLYLLGQQ